MSEHIAELKRYAELEGSEFGEAVKALIQLREYKSAFSDDFAMATEDEVDNVLKWFRQNTLIEKRTLSREYIHEELVYLDRLTDMV